MNQEQKEALEQKLNNPSRLRFSTYDDNILRSYQILNENILSEDVRKVKMVLGSLVDNTKDSERDEVNRLILAYMKFVETRATCKNNPDFVEQLKNAERHISAAVNKKMRTEEVKKLYAVCSDEEKVKEVIRSKSPQEKQRLLNDVVEYYHSTNADDATFVRMNKVLKSFNRKVVREVLGVEGQDPTKNSPEAIAAYRAVFGGRFFAKDIMECSQKYQDFANGKISKEMNSPQDYDLLHKNPYFKSMKNSRNVQLIISSMQQILSKTGIPVKMAAELTLNDFGHIVQRFQGDTRFEALNNACVIEPRKEFCQELLKNKESYDAIRNDFLKNGVSKEYFAFWAESMMKDGEPNPKLEGRQFDGIIPKKIDIHHKWPLKYAADLDKNGKDNLIMVVKFGKRDMHDEEHIGDSETVMTVNPNPASRRDPTIFRSMPKQGETAVVERFVYDSGDGKDNRCYVSESLTLTSDMANCRDYCVFKDVEPAILSAQQGRMRA